MADEAKPADAPSTPTDRLQAALAEREQRFRDDFGANAQLRGYRGPKREEAFIEVAAGDLAEAAAALGEHDTITAALHKGGKVHKPDRSVTIRADDLYHLLDRAAGKAPAAEDMPHGPP